MKKKFLFFLFFFFLLFLFIQELQNYKEEEKHYSMKSNIKDSINQITVLKEKKEYYGYIEIPKLKLKKPIIPYYDKKLLDKNFVCIYFSTNFLEKKVGNTLLVGHNNKGLFEKLYQLDKNDKVIIYVGDKKYIYRFFEKKEVVYNKYKYLYEKKNHLISLITCTKNKNKRLIVTLKEEI